MGVGESAQGKWTPGKALLEISRQRVTRKEMESSSRKEGRKSESEISEMSTRIRPRVSPESWSHRRAE